MKKTRVGFGRAEVSVHRSKALREIFRMGMVSGVLVFKGVATVGFFMFFFVSDFSGRKSAGDLAPT